jgi:hypothetical protein
MKKFLTTLLMSTLAVTGLINIATAPAAQAVTPSSNLYSLNIATQNAEGRARNFVELNGKTYFVATSVSLGNAIWAVDGDPSHAPELIYDIAEGSTSGAVYSMYGFGDYLFYWYANTKVGEGLKAHVIDLRTKAVKFLETADGEIAWNWESPWRRGEIYT